MYHSDIVEILLTRDYPEDHVVDNILSKAKWGWTKDEALVHQKKLMNNRKYYIGANNNMWEREYKEH